VALFDTAAMYSGGASEQRLGELAEGRRVVIATKFPPAWLSKAEALPDALDQSLARLRRTATPHRPRGAGRAGDSPCLQSVGRYFRSGGLKKVQPVMALLREIGEGHAKTPAQVTLRWLIEQDGVLSIPGAKNERQAASNAEALSFSLVGAEIEALDQATTAWRR
jgi:aryl-alcohol dehydrogenase-like predicted oxidoreductase